MAQSIRRRGPTGVRLERFKEASEDKDTGLTYSALVGSDKQSIRDAEKLLSPAVLLFMQTKGYEEEAKLVKACLNWHRASDERGLTQEQRSLYNHDMLQYIHDEFLPWQKATEAYDYSTLEVNR